MAISTAFSTRMSQVLIKLLQTGERVLQLLQGKGTGSHSLRSEARTARRFLPRGAIVFDVGANKGQYTLQLLRQSSDRISQIHLFEPVLANCETLKQINDPRVIVNCFGLGDKEEQRQLYSDAIGSGLGSLYDRQLSYRGIAMRYREIVSISTLDKYVHDLSVEKIDLLKLDVEGHELCVLKGARDSLERRISAIQFEFGGCNVDSRTYFRDFWELLTGLGFRISVLSPIFGLLAIPAYSETLECFSTTNFYASRRAPAAESKVKR